LRAGAATAIAMIGMLLGAPVEAASWSNPSLQPTPGPARAIGAAWDGCLAGAVALPWDGAGFEVIHPSRHRYFGHPATVAFVERLGRRARAAGLPLFYVGDMAQPRGGPMAYGHAAHQNGLDVDIWFTGDTVSGLSVAARDALEPPSMVLADQRRVDPARFGPQQVRLLRLAAHDPAVDRIFVNPAIKQALCRGYGGMDNDRRWLRRIRPWYGHRGHFHVRLKCPPGSRLCRSQPPSPPGDGCAPAVFAWWSRALSKPPPPVRSRPAAPLPAACQALAPAN